MALDDSYNRAGGKPMTAAPTMLRPEFERDNCGFGLIAQMDARPSHWLVQTAIRSLARMTHRGAIAADGKTGDGCGLLMKKPDGFFRCIAEELGFTLGELYAVGVVFQSHDDDRTEQTRRIIANAIQARGLSVVGWRRVPTNPEACGAEALVTMPQVDQVFVNASDGMPDRDFESALYIARRQAEKELEESDPDCYIASLSGNVLSYKGLVMPANLSVFYPDLHDERFESALCVYHQRFSTNTAPQWRLAQPFRYLAHNGEINTLQGNRNWGRARAAKFETPLIPDMELVRPLVSQKGSDSYSLDNMVEGLIMGGMDMLKAMRILIPPAWQNVKTMDPALRAFFEFYSMHQEPWDGPAGIVLTDGRYAACSMDRNGLRPARYIITKDRHITLASEIGVYDYDEADIEAKGRLKPGQMIAADTWTGELLLPEDVDRRVLGDALPYRDWLDQHAMRLTPDPAREADVPVIERDELNVYQKQFQVTFEERDQVLRVLAEAGAEAVGSMGDDTPMPVLSQKTRSPYDYFRQQFAQVTNPAIDPLRERVVMSLTTAFGVERNVFEATSEHASRIEVPSPVLSHDQFQDLLETEDERFRHAFVDLTYPADGNLREALEQVCTEAEAAVRQGATLLILTDRNISRDRVPVHALLATGAVHHRLIAADLRCDANIVVETATARDPHHFAVLLGYGATAVFPYLAYQCLADMTRSGEIEDKDIAELWRKYRAGIDKGLLKVLSKMGISTIASYRGAQLFEIVGLHEEVVDRCFTRSTSRIQGTNFDDLEADQRALAKRAWTRRKPIEQGGLLKFVHGQEYHAYHPDVIHTLHKAVQSGDYGAYKIYSQVVDNRPVAMLRDLLKVRDDVTPVAIDDVEPAEEILPRFDSAGMSLGALSPEAHEALAIAMNRLGGRSNSGEGGEDPRRYNTEKTSKIKQVASGRFGVTPAYLTSAEVAQIKIAQGAKPGEGGQLPGHKVDPLIAKLRYARPGVPLISPPPHHDIYSIEDLAQLIFDLKQVNPDMLVSVKLVAEAGVGTVAAGVAKAYADLITISGYDGGTGASPLTSVKYAGSPWEMGLTETQQALRANNLRDKVRVQTDGGLKTGLDVVKAAILGAESFGFGTAPMVALGCKYLRICHLNNCATGVATQNHVLRRAHFIGLPEMVMNYFRFVAEETREWMAKLGVTRLTDLIGRTDLLEVLLGETERQQRLDLSPILSDGGVPADRPRFCTVPKNAPFDQGELNEQIVADAIHAVESRSGGTFHYEIHNTDRSIGARLSGEIARRYGNHGMEEDPIVVRLRGVAGQSLGVWNAGGLKLYLDGDANDYVGKGMAGGKLVLRPTRASHLETRRTPIMGNTCLYGATGGKLFAAGQAGERFGVRNSGCHAVVEAAGDHACEYMTGGAIAILGNAGENFGAGMTGGLAFVYDEDGQFEQRYNPELIDLHRVDGTVMRELREYLYGMLEEHVAETGSGWGQHLLDHFDQEIARFWLAKPRAADIETLLEVMVTKAA